MTRVLRSTGVEQDDQREPEGLCTRERGREGGQDSKWMTQHFGNTGVGLMLGCRSWLSPTRREMEGASAKERSKEVGKSTTTLL